MEMCIPWWASKFDDLTKQTQITVSSGCTVNSAGNVACSPESMRASAESRMRAAGLGSLGLETYTLARYMQSEVGSGSIFERVAVGEAARNRARLEGTTINGLLLFRQKSGHPNRGFYGPIHGPEGVTTAPYGRWAATTRDPTVLTLLLANLITSGQSGDFARGAQDQDGPEYWASKGQTALDNYVRGLAAHGEYWVGPLLGVDHWRTFLQIRAAYPSSSVQGQVLLSRGLEALQLPVRRPKWDLSALAMCSGGPPVDTNALIAMGVVGTIAGAWMFVSGLFHGIAKSR